MMDKKPPETNIDRTLKTGKSDFKPTESVNSDGIANKVSTAEFAAFVDNDPITSQDIFPQVENDVYNFILKPTPVKIPEFTTQLFTDRQFDYQRLINASRRDGATPDDIDQQILNGKLPSAYLLNRTTATAAMGIYQFQRTAQMTYMRKMLALSYSQNKATLSLSSTMGDMGKMLEAKLEAIKLNTAAPEARKSSLVARFRETFTNQSMIAAAQWTRNQVFGRARNIINRRLGGPIASKALDLFSNRADIGDISDEVRNALVRILGKGSAYTRSVADDISNDRLRSGLTAVARRGMRAQSALRAYEPSDKTRDRAQEFSKFLRKHLPAANISNSISKFLDTLGGDFIINANDGSASIRTDGTDGDASVKGGATSSVKPTILPTGTTDTENPKMEGGDSFTAYFDKTYSFQDTVTGNLAQIIKLMEECGCNQAPGQTGRRTRTAEEKTPTETGPKFSPRERVEPYLDKVRDNVKDAVDRVDTPEHRKQARRLKDRVLRAVQLKPYSDESLKDQVTDKAKTLYADAQGRLAVPVSHKQLRRVRDRALRSMHFQPYSDESLKDQVTDKAKTLYADAQGRLAVPVSHKQLRRVRDRALRSMHFQPYSDESLMDQTRDKVHTAQDVIRKHLDAGLDYIDADGSKPDIKTRLENARTSLQAQMDRAREDGMSATMRRAVDSIHNPTVDYVRQYTQDLHDKLADTDSLAERYHTIHDSVMGNIRKHFNTKPVQDHPTHARTSDMQQMLDDLNAQYGALNPPSPAKSKTARSEGSETVTKMIGGLQSSLSRLDTFLENNDAYKSAQDRVNSYKNLVARMTPGGPHPPKEDDHDLTESKPSHMSGLFGKAKGLYDWLTDKGDEDGDGDHRSLKRKLADSLFDHIFKDDDEDDSRGHKSKRRGLLGKHHKSRGRRLWEGTFRGASKVGRFGVRSLGKTSRFVAGGGLDTVTHGSQAIAKSVARAAFGDGITGKMIGGASSLGLGMLGGATKLGVKGALWGAEKAGTTALGLGAGLLGHAPGMIRGAFSLGKGALRMSPWALGGMALGALTDHFTTQGSIANRLGKTGAKAAEYGALGSIFGPVGTAAGATLGAVVANMDLVSKGFGSLGNMLWGSKTKPDDIKKIEKKTDKSTGLLTHMTSSTGGFWDGVKSVFGVSDANASGLTDDQKKLMWGKDYNRLSGSRSSEITPPPSAASPSPASGTSGSIYGSTLPSGGDSYGLGGGGDAANLYGEAPIKVAPVTGSVADRAKQGVDYLVSKKGWDRNQAIGLIANLVKESKLDPNAVGDGGLARGMVQWHPDRQAAIQKQFHVADIRQLGFTGQLDAIDWELKQGSERGAWKHLSAAQTPQQAAHDVSLFYERPAGGQREATERAAIATNLIKTVGDGTTAVASADGTGATGAAAGAGAPGSTAPGATAGAPASATGSGTAVADNSGGGGTASAATAKVDATTKAATKAITPAEVASATTPTSSTPTASTSTMRRAATLAQLNEAASTNNPLDHDQTASAVKAGMNDHVAELATHLKTMADSLTQVASNISKPAKGGSTQPVVISNNTTNVHTSPSNDLSLSREGNRSGVTV